MSRSNILAALFFVISVFSCRTAPEPLGQSQAVPPEQISLGGLIAEELAAPSDSLAPESPVYTESIDKLLDMLENAKAKRSKRLPDELLGEWENLQKKISIGFETVSRQDIRQWTALNDSLLKYFGQVRFSDELERMIYNSRLPEVLDGKAIKTFYYTRLYDRIYVNIFGSSSLEYEHTTGGIVRIFQDTEYPNEEKVTLKIELQDTRYLDLYVRIPEWSNYASVTVKGVRYPANPGEYSEIARKWKNGDEVEVILNMRPVVTYDDHHRFAFNFGSLFLGYIASGQDSIAFPENNYPEEYLQFATPAGGMPTFTFTGLPDKALVLQPFFAETEPGEKRTRWIRSN